MIDHVDTLERALVAAGFPPMSPWWRSTVEHFYASGRCQLVLRVGRRGGKSSTLCRLGVIEALFGEHAIPPGDVGVVGFVSVGRDESAKRIRTITAILDALKVGHRPLREGFGIELVIGFKLHGLGFFNSDNAVFTDFVHHVCNQLTHFSISG